MSLISDAVDKIVELIKDGVSEYDGRVYAFHAEREDIQDLPAAAVGIGDINVDLRMMRTWQVSDQNNNYVAKRFGDYEVALRITIAASRKAVLLPLIEKTIGTLVQSLSVVSDTGFGKLANIVENTTGEELQLRITPTPLSISVDKMDVDYIEATINGVLLVPFVVVQARPLLDIQSNIDVTQGG